MKFARLVALFCGLGLISFQVNASESKEINWAQFVPKDAQNVVAADQVTWKQISFSVNRQYPEFAFNEEKFIALKQSGWTICKPSPTDWSNYLDRANGENRRIYQRNIFVFRKDELVIMSASYRSKAINTPQPDSTIQFGVIRQSKSQAEQLESIRATTKCSSN